MPKVVINGKTISLGNRDFLAQGGEGAVYAKGGKAYKIYSDKSKMIPAGKIRELSVLTNPNIIKPEDVIFSGKKAVGYTMRYVPKSVSLCQIFTKSFKDRNAITPKKSFALVQNMKETVRHVHENGILIVDLNEMNFLASSNFKEVYFIDVDSYQTPTHKATAIMESIRDRHCKIGEFNTGTDWFSFAVVSFQVFIGIHPYKGKHKSLKGLEDRMTNNVSVFNQSVKIPKSCLSIDLIPSNWRDWYEAVFEDGMRCAPPAIGEVIGDMVTIVATIIGSNNFTIKELFECNSDIINYEPNFGNECVMCKDGFRLRGDIHVPYDIPSIIGYHGSSSFAVRIENETIKVFNVKRRVDVEMNDIQATNLMASGGRIYAKQSDKILELQFIGTEYEPIITAKIVGTVMEQATKLFPGVAIQSVLGSYYISIFPESGKCFQHRVDDLTGYQIVNAKFESGVLMVIGVKNGKYDRFVYSVGSDISTARIINDLQGNGINFTVLDNGICICITDTEEVEVFSRDNVKKIKVVQDNVIHGGMHLFHDGNSGMFSDGKKMFTMKMK